MQENVPRVLPQRNPDKSGDWRLSQNCLGKATADCAESSAGEPSRLESERTPQPPESVITPVWPDIKMSPPPPASSAVAAQPRNRRIPSSAQFLNRELGILAFNRRVLAQAADESVPILERLRFITIVSSNLDEFFEIRVAGLKESIKLGLAEPGPDGQGAA